jgi:hypothetical protein
MISSACAAFGPSSRAPSIFFLEAGVWGLKRSRSWPVASLRRALPRLGVEKLSL